MKELIIKEIDNINHELVELSEYIYHNPELGFEEHKSAKAHINLLKKHGFICEENFIGFATAFRATFDSGKPGPTIAFMAEYDALPEIGHGCGHNLLGTVSSGAAIAYSKLIEKGKVIVLGSPAEETSGVKVDMVAQGVFNDVDIAMMAHPEAYHEESGSSLALVPIEFRFTGKSAHAATAPEKGINALDACIQTFNGLNALREHIEDSARIHGVITDGGLAANIVPDYSAAQFYIRTVTRSYMDTLEERVINCAKGAALSAGTTLEYFNYEKVYDNLVTNMTLSNVYNESVKDVGVDNMIKSRLFPGSLDMGNVSQVCPSIHPFFGICKDEAFALHTKGFRECTITDEANKSMRQAIYGLVKTSITVGKEPELLKAIKDEFANNKVK